MDTSEPTAFDIINEVTRQVSFDELMRRGPETYSDADWLQLIRLQRQRRAAAVAKQEARKDKKENPE